MKIDMSWRMAVAMVAGLPALVMPLAAGAAAWEPTKPVEFVIPAGTGGGADQMARLVQGIIAKHNLMKQSLVVINKAGGAGGEGFARFNFGCPRSMMMEALERMAEALPVNG